METCINEYDIFGNPLKKGPNLIMIKVSENKYLCLTPFEAYKLLEQKRFDVYTLPNLQIYVDEEFKNLIDQKFNTMEIIPTNKEKELDYEGNKRKIVKVYTVKPLERLDEGNFFQDDEDEKEDEINMKEILEMARKQKEQFEAKFKEHKEKQEDVKKILTFNTYHVSIVNNEDIQIAVLGEDIEYLFVSNCPNLILIKFNKSIVSVKINHCPKIMSLRIGSKCDTLYVENCERFYDLKIYSKFIFEIYIENCLKFEVVPAHLQITKNLAIINCPVKDLKYDNENGKLVLDRVYLENLKLEKIFELNIERCNYLKSIQIQDLKRLKIDSCKNLKDINVESVTAVYLKNLNIEKIPDFKDITNLNIFNCEKLEYFNLPNNVNTLSVENIPLKTLNLSVFKNITHLNVKVPDLVSITFPPNAILIKLNSNKLRNIPYIPNKVEEIFLNCPELIEIPNISKSLKNINCTNCLKLDKIPYLERTIGFSCVNCSPKMNALVQYRGPAFEEEEIIKVEEGG